MLITIRCSSCVWVPERGCMMGATSLYDGCQDPSHRLYHGDKAVVSWGITPSYNLFTPYGGATRACDLELTKRLMKEKKISRITPEHCCCEQQDTPHEAWVSLRACAMVTLRQSWVRSRLGYWKKVVGWWEEVVACLQNTSTFVSNGWSRVCNLRQLPLAVATLKRVVTDERIELPAKLLDYFLRKNKGNVNPTSSKPEHFVSWPILYLKIELSRLNLILNVPRRCFNSQIVPVFARVKVVVFN